MGIALASNRIDHTSSTAPFLHPSVRLAKALWAASLAGLLLFLITLPRMPMPWVDEFLLASTSLSHVSGGPQVPTILGAFPTPGRFDFLYGPVMFILGDLDLRLVGLSLIGWRMLGYLGAVALTLAAAWVAKILDQSPTTSAAAAALVVFSQGMGARATSGRLDTVVVGLELICLGFGLRAFGIAQQKGRAWIDSIASGLLGGLAVMSTPRAYPFALGFGAAVVLEIARRTERRALVARALMVGLSALTPIVVWTLRVHSSPFQWIRFVLSTSHGDHLDVSPLFGGSWHLMDGPLLPRASGMLIVLVAAIILTAFMHLRGRLPLTATDAALRFSLTAILINYVATFLLVARFWDYEIFVVPCLLLAMAVVTAKILRVPTTRWVRNTVLTGWICLAAALLSIRGGKTLLWALSYEERAPGPVAEFVAANIPRGSRVFGPDNLYFYAVERAGSRYLLVYPWAPPGLLNVQSFHPDWAAEVRNYSPVFLVWPANRSRPAGLDSIHLFPVARFEPRKLPQAHFLGSLARDMGYGPANLYRLSPTNNAAPH